MEQRKTGTDRRRDERFAVYSNAKSIGSPVKLILVDRPDREVQCQISDISASGMRLVGGEDLPEGTRVVVELETMLVLVEIRYSYPQGSKFVMGAQKQNTTLKLALPDDATVTEKIRALTGNNNIHQSVTEPAHGVSDDSSELAPVPPFLAEVSAILAQAPVLDAEADSGSATSSDAVGQDLAPAEQEPAPEPADERPSISLPVAAPRDDPHACAASGIAIAEGSPAARPGRWWITAGLSCMFVASAGFASLFGPFRQDAHPSSAAALVPVPIVVNTVQVDTAAAPVKSESASTRPLIRAVVLSHGVDWVSACSDGKETHTKLLMAGDSLYFDFATKAVLRVGDSGATEITLDGKPVGPFGRPGSPRVISLDENGLTYLSGLPADGSGDCAVK